MSKNTIELNDHLYSYLLFVSLKEDPVLTALRNETNKMEMSMMQISPDQGQFMALLVKLMGVKRILEIGTFTGYSALVMAKSLPDDGELIACDISQPWTTIAKKYWQQAGVIDKIHLKLAPAEKTLKELLLLKQQSSFDLVFIDADKQNQWLYYEYCFELIRPGGLIVIDNVLWGGSVANALDDSESTIDIREFNQKLYNDKRVDLSTIAVGDGITLARKI